MTTGDSTTRAPTHPDILEVRYQPGFHLSAAHSLVALPAGAVFAKLTFPPLTNEPAPTWATVQTGRDTHIDLNSDLVYCNHSCAPTLEFDMHKFEIRVARDHPNGGIVVGEELTFFYPSSEWNMSQPFECRCGAGEGICKGTIAGAKDMGRERLKGYWLNPHIEELLDELEGKPNGAANGTTNGAANGTPNGATNGAANGAAKEEDAKKKKKKTKSCVMM
ncbi:hypothetical protein EX30DRAFT_128711 [Ascodesmis nigricans]|uniref:Post-SET domain-containing protein n=1 Tax=Ascodesmis nigricans TaxID=341454 RepID=A0A4S2MSG8_9PEZI|nr:hypothetical protein EX30DRAFT_128711 [Ascodesmis nigricans]